MQLKNIIETLHPIERKVVPHLKDKGTLSQLEKASNLSQVEAMRALQWLTNKEVLTIEDHITRHVVLDVNGEEFLKKGFPERRFLEAIKKAPKSIPEILKSADLEKNEVNICLGTLKGKAAIAMEKGSISITENGKKILAKESLEEQFIAKKFPIDENELADEERFAFESLKKRKNIVKIKEEKEKTIHLSDIGKKLAKTKLEETHVEETLTHEMLKKGSWKDKTFRKFDVDIKVPKLHAGKKHFVNQAMSYIKKIWLEMGFEEMEGNMIQTSFWNLDALFIPQDHPARAMQDTFYIKNPSKGKLPKLASNIKAVHETGADTGSTGWGNKWSKDVAEKNMLRTHTTVLSAQTIAKLKTTDLPKKFFSVGKVFRNEALDSSHLFEFFQVEGIVIDPNANMKHLKGYLQEFYKKMGLKVRMRPAHFPYTEPSVEVDFYDEKKKKWVEFAGAGIFRPEVVKPLLGREVPVLAWGNGLDRIISEYYKITDIRDLYNNDLKKLKDRKNWVK